MSYIILISNIRIRIFCLVQYTTLLFLTFALVSLRFRSIIIAICVVKFCNVAPGIIRISFNCIDIMISRSVTLGVVLVSIETRSAYLVLLLCIFLLLIFLQFQLFHYFIFRIHGHQRRCNHAQACKPT